jgi:hypothetical protein
MKSRVVSLSNQFSTSVTTYMNLGGRALETVSRDKALSAFTSFIIV